MPYLPIVWATQPNLPIADYTSFSYIPTLLSTYIFGCGAPSHGKTKTNQRCAGSPQTVFYLTDHDDSTRIDTFKDSFFFCAFLRCACLLWPVTVVVWLPTKEEKGYTRRNLTPVCIHVQTAKLSRPDENSVHHISHSSLLGKQKQDHTLFLFARFLFFLDNERNHYHTHSLSFFIRLERNDKLSHCWTKLTFSPFSSLRFCFCFLCFGKVQCGLVGVR